MHTIFETDAFILKSTTTGEANKHFDLFTQDFGLIRASAQGVRYLKSKLRYSLTEYSLIHVSLVRGKEFWRITTATKISDTMADLSTKVVQQALLRIFSLLRRLLQGEETHKELFEVIMTMYETLKDFEKRNSFELETSDTKDFNLWINAVEEVTVLRILHLLGYVNDLHFKSYIDISGFTKELLLQAIQDRKSIVMCINKALTESHL